MKKEHNATSPNKLKKHLKISTIVRWIFGVLFALLILATGFHYSSLFLIGASFFMLPLPFVTSFLKKHNVKSPLIITLSLLLLISGLISSPKLSESKFIFHESDTENEESNSESINSDSDSSNSSSETNEATTNGTFVFVSASGNKYHSKPNCSNMRSPSPISLDDARLQGYEPCKKCN